MKGRNTQRPCWPFQVQVTPRALIGPHPVGVDDSASTATRGFEGSHRLLFRAIVYLDLEWGWG